jgi:hypothetical protein
MRLLALTLLLVSASACGDRRTFDERYRDTGQELENRAEQLDRNLEATNLPEPAEQPAG